MILKANLALNSAIFRYGSAKIRFFVTQRDAKIDNFSTEEDIEFLNAKPYNKITGPSKVSFLLSFLPGGKYYQLPINKLLTSMRKEYGNITKIPGMFGKPDVVLTFEPHHFQKVYRSEGVWPFRLGIDTMDYYRSKLRPDIFGEHQGLLNSQGKQWGDFRTAVNPVMMQPKTTKLYVPVIDVIATDFVKRIRYIRNASTMQVPENFEDEINRWSLESIGVIALNTRFGLIADKFDPKATKMIESIKAFFDLIVKLDFNPSIWRIVKTPAFHKLMETLNTVTDLSKDYVEAARKKIESEPQKNGESVLEKLLKIDPIIAQVMAMDMIFVGVDTTTSAFVGLLYLLAKNPDQQETLRQEVLAILPEKDTALTTDKMNSMPYLRACIKEALRLYPVTNGNIRASAQDIVLGGYQIPKGTNILMGSTSLQLEDGYYPSANQFKPERWLKDTAKAKCQSTAKSAHPFIYLPFGFGPRMCIGRRFAEMEIEILTARIVRNFFVKWEHAEMKFKTTSLNFPDCELMFTFIDNNE